MSAFDDLGDEVCGRLPDGFWCCRSPGHEGPHRTPGMVDRGARERLAALERVAAAAREAYVEWYEETGLVGGPVRTELARALTELDKTGGVK